ncbi:MAG TPA: glycosyltransferase [Microlunatus sp.]|nr:glycosyltransferase [Microlunatus sp.]
MFSVVMPTLQRSSLLIPLLGLYCESPAVSEIVVINNSREAIPFDHQKVRFIQPRKNIFVNPAWNLGVANATSDYLVISNDDVLFDIRILPALVNVLGRRTGIVGPDRSCFVEVTEFDSPRGADPIPEPSVEPVSYRPYGFGTLMFMRRANFTPIPEDMKIWCGDDWLFRHQRGINYRLTGIAIASKMGSTSRQPQFSDRKKADIRRYREAYAENPYLARFEGRTARQQHLATVRAAARRARRRIAGAKRHVARLGRTAADV